jgi:hypothetical protein
VARRQVNISLLDLPRKEISSFHRRTSWLSQPAGRNRATQKRSALLAFSELRDFRWLWSRRALMPEKISLERPAAPQARYVHHHAYKNSVAQAGFNDIVATTIWILLEQRSPQPVD